MIINNFDPVRVTIAPDEADTPLIIYADAVLPFSLSSQRFEPVARRRGQISQYNRSIYLTQFSKRDSLDVFKPLDRFSLMEPLSVSFERKDLITVRVYTLYIKCQAEKRRQRTETARPHSSM